jgi:hypothetical protein
MKNYYKMFNSDGEELGRWVGAADENQHRLGEVINGVIAVIVVDDTSAPDLETPIRQQRNALLAVSDWTQVADAPVDQAAWAAYRQALRDLPASTADFANIVWPQPPQT